MSEQPNDGGPAFPMASDVTGHQSGMSLRDWFAGMATDADINMYRVQSRFADGRFVPDLTREQAKYPYADAMLAAREVKP